MPRFRAIGFAPAATFFNNQGPNQQDLADQLKGYVHAYLKREKPYTPNLTVYSTSSVPNFHLAAAFSVVLALTTFVRSTEPSGTLRSRKSQHSTSMWAGKRLITRVRREHPQMALIMIGSM